MDPCMAVLESAVTKFSTFIDMLEQEQYKNRFLAAKTAAGVLFRQAADLSDAIGATSVFKQTYEEERTLSSVTIMQLEDEAIQHRQVRNELESRITHLESEIDVIQKRHTTAEQLLRTELGNANLSYDLKREANAVLKQDIQLQYRSFVSALSSEKDQVHQLERTVKAQREELESAKLTCESQYLSRRSPNKTKEQPAKDSMQHIGTSDRVVPQIAKASQKRGDLHLFEQARLKHKTDDNVSGDKHKKARRNSDVDLFAPRAVDVLETETPQNLDSHAQETERVGNVRILRAPTTVPQTLIEPCTLKTPAYMDIKLGANPDWNVLSRSGVLSARHPSFLTQPPLSTRQTEHSKHHGGPIEDVNELSKSSPQGLGKMRQARETTITTLETKFSELEVMLGLDRRKYRSRTPEHDAQMTVDPNTVQATNSVEDETAVSLPGKGYLYRRWPQPFLPAIDYPITETYIPDKDGQPAPEFRIHEFYCKGEYNISCLHDVPMVELSRKGAHVPIDVLPLAPVNDGSESDDEFDLQACFRRDDSTDYGVEEEFERQLHYDDAFDHDRADSQTLGPQFYVPSRISFSGNLVTAIGRFSNLHKIQINYPRHTDPLLRAQEILDYYYAWFETVLHVSNELLNHVMNNGVSTLRSISLDQLTLSDVGCGDVYANAPRPNASLFSITSLEFVFTSRRRGMDERDATISEYGRTLLPCLIQICDTLTSLKVSSTTTSGLETISFRSHLPDLRHLKTVQLQNLAISESDLRKLLMPSAGTLSDLVLEDVGLFDGS
ncbi:hypothetical protein FKW77_002039 [Venturia effusa]|uniref:Uncharacterized protein n=1 Tax=Venturia effusa TaxID=50376 RepID=A0A517LKY1_9PEZI|nr:hypothetical protein FKW77_002039 [Venturia effusa]